MLKCDEQLETESKRKYLSRNMIKRVSILVHFIVFNVKAISQEWFKDSITIKLHNVATNSQLSKFRFSYVEGSRTMSETFVFCDGTRLATFSFMTMGGGPFLIIRKAKKKMVIAANQQPGDVDQIFIRFRSGIYEIRNGKSRKIKGWSKKRSTLKYIGTKTEKPLKVLFNSQMCDADN